MNVFHKLLSRKMPRSFDAELLRRNETTHRPELNYNRQHLT